MNASIPSTSTTLGPSAFKESTLKEREPSMFDGLLPSPEAFVARSAVAESVKLAKEDSKASVEAGVSALQSSQLSHPANLPGNEFRSLLVSYAATCAEAYELSQVPWGPLAKRLGTHSQLLEEVATSLAEDGSFWNDVLATRIKRVSAAKVFRDASWERLESMAVGKLLQLAERNMIRDPGELLAIASAARRANTPNTPGVGAGTTVNLNFGEGGSEMGDNGLPAAGAKMTIDLSPRVAKSLQERNMLNANSKEPRVIDGEMLSAAELRSMLETQRNGEQKSDEDPAEET